MAKRTLAENVNQAISDFADIKTAIADKGVSVPAGTPTSEYADKIRDIETGVDTSGDTVVPSAMREGFTAHDAEGNPITGTIPNYDGSVVQGAVEGAEAKYNEGVADGIETVRDRIQGNQGSRNYYSYFYWASYPYDLIPPKYPVNFGGSWSGRQAFAWNDRIKEISVDIIMSGTDIGGDCFAGSKNLHTIKKIAMESGTVISHWFDYCTALQNLTIEGTIGRNGFDVSWSPLNKESLTSIVNALSDTTTGLTVTLRLAAVNTAFETAEGIADGSSSDEWLALAATKPNWTINLINS